MIKYLIVLCTLIACMQPVHAQQKKVAAKHATAKHKVKPPAFVKASTNYSTEEYLVKNMRYPENAKEAGVEGKVIVQFVVDETGSTTNAKVTRGIGAGCDEEARRVVMAMPKWKPATYAGKPTKMYYTLPVIFRLE